MNDKIKIRFEEDKSFSGIEICIRAPEKSREVDALIEYITGAPEETLLIERTDGTVLRILQSNIVLVSVSGRILNIVTEEKRYTVKKQLCEFEELLDKNKFVRISRYEIVNTDKIKKLDVTLAGSLRIELSSGIETWASRRCIPTIQDRLMRKD